MIMFMVMIVATFAIEMVAIAVDMTVVVVGITLAVGTTMTVVTFAGAHVVHRKPGVKPCLAKSPMLLLTNL